MSEFYKMISKFLHMILNVLFGFQILFLILIFMVTAYWLFDLLNFDLFRFAKPIAQMSSDFIKLFYPYDWGIGEYSIDGSLLIFDVFAFVLVFVLTKIKCYIYYLLGQIDNKIYDCRKEEEKVFNKDLSQEVEHKIKRDNNIAVLIQFDAKNISLNSYLTGVFSKGGKECSDKAFKVLYDSVKNISGCKFAKTDDKMLILLSDFNKADNLLLFLVHAYEHLKVDLRKENWLLTAYIAVDVYGNNVNFNSEIYPTLEKLLNLRHKNHPICFSTFKVRYDYLEDAMFNLVPKGEYGINGESQVWTLIKKD